MPGLEGPFSMLVPGAMVQCPTIKSMATTNLRPTHCIPRDTNHVKQWMNETRQLQHYQIRLSVHFIHKSELFLVERSYTVVVFSGTWRRISGDSTVRLEGRVALVTGAAMGIGNAIAQLFAQEGARVVAADIDGCAGAATAKKIQEAGGHCFFRHCDVSEESEVKAVVASGSKEFGQAIDVLLNVVGIAHASPAHLLDLADWERIPTEWYCRLHGSLTPCRTVEHELSNA